MTPGFACLSAAICLSAQNLCRASLRRSLLSLYRLLRPHLSTSLERPNRLALGHLCLKLKNNKIRTKKKKRFELKTNLYLLTAFLQRRPLASALRLLTSVLWLCRLSPPLPRRPYLAPQRRRRASASLRRRLQRLTVAALLLPPPPAASWRRQRSRRALRERRWRRPTRRRTWRRAQSRRSFDRGARTRRPPYLLQKARVQTPNFDRTFHSLAYKVRARALQQNLERKNENAKLNNHKNVDQEKLGRLFLRFFTDAPRHLNLPTLCALLAALCSANEDALRATITTAASSVVTRRLVSDVYAPACALPRIVRTINAAFGVKRPLAHRMRAWGVVGEHFVEVSGV